MVSAISLGTWAHGGPSESGGRPVGWSGHNDEQSKKALLRAWELGINHWDTADVYGNGHAEALIGAVWNDVPREDIFLASKVGWDQGAYSHFYNPDHMRAQLERTLNLLKTDAVDLYYFHHCLFGKQHQYLDVALETMHRFKDEGKIRWIGLSDWNLTKIMAVIDRVNPDVIQPYRNVQDDSYVSSGLKTWVDKNNAGVVFFSPLKHGLLTGKYDQPVKFPAGDFRSNIPEFGDNEMIQRLKNNKQALEDRFSNHPNPVLHGITGALFFDSPTGCVLLGQRNPSQVEAASTLGEELSAADAEWIFNLYQ